MGFDFYFCVFRAFRVTKVKIVPQFFGRFIFLHFLLLFQNNCLTLHDKVHDFAYENDDTDSENERAAGGALAA